MTDVATDAKILFDKTFPPIDRHTLALYCGVSGDSNPIHVDSDFAKAAGFPDVFAHGMLAMAYLGTALEDAGIAANLRNFRTRFKAVTQLGAQLRCTGTVSPADGAAIDLQVVDQFGDVKLAGSATLNS